MGRALPGAKSPPECSLSSLSLSQHIPFLFPSSPSPPAPDSGFLASCCLCAQGLLLALPAKTKQGFTLCAAIPVFQKHFSAGQLRQFSSKAGTLHKMPASILCSNSAWVGVGRNRNLRKTSNQAKAETEGLKSLTLNYYRLKIS